MCITLADLNSNLGSLTRNTTDAKTNQMPNKVVKPAKVLTKHLLLRFCNSFRISDWDLLMIASVVEYECMRDGIDKGVEKIGAIFFCRNKGYS